MLLACGPKQEAKAPPKPTASAAPVVVEEPPDLSPVKRPAEIVVTGRIAQPRQFVDTVTKWSNVPLKIEDLLPREARALSSAVQWDAPVDLLVALDPFGEGKVPTPLIIGSVGLTSLDAALSAADSLQIPTRKLSPGIYRVGDFPDVSCALAVAVGKAPARLVCGRGTKDVDFLLPYATRGLPTEAPSGADAELTLQAKPLQDHYSNDVSGLRLLAGLGVRQIALDSPLFDRAVSDAVYGAVDETINFFNDLESVHLEAKLDTKRNVLAGFSEVRLKSDSSWTAGTIAACKPQALPADLPRLPPNATLGAYNPPWPAERYAAIGRIAGDLAEGFLEYEKVPAATRKRVRHFTDAWLSAMPESFSFAMNPTQKDAVGARHAATTLVRLSEPSARVTGMYSDLFGILGDAALKRLVKQKAELKIDDKLWPKLVKKPFKLAGFKAPATLFEVTADTKAWAALDERIARVLKNVLPADGTNEVKRIDVLVQPDGDHTYVLTGDDPAEMARVMAEHRKSEPGTTFPKPANENKVVVAGFMTLAYVGHSLEQGGKNPQLGKAIASAPNHGETPIPFSASTGKGSMRIDVELPAQVLGDLSAASVAAAPAFKDALEN